MSRRKAGRNALISEFKCQNCGSLTYLPRIDQREFGHVKDIWCVHCKDITKHLEFKERSWDKYWLEDIGGAN